MPPTLTSMTSPSECGPGLVLLAAGGSKRLGQPKQLVRFGRRTLIRRALDTALATSCRPIVVVLGGHAERVRVEIDAPAIHVIEHACWEEGIGSSLRAGLTECLRLSPGMPAVALMLVDQPLVTSSHLERLVSLQHEEDASIVCSRYAGTLGVPAVFGRSRFSELLALENEQGAKRLILAHAPHVLAVECMAATLDVDTPGDLTALRSLPPLD